jgi:tetratricopeptide (TPR) repeat protein
MIHLRSVGGWIVVFFSPLVWAGGEGFTADESFLALEQELQVLVSSGADQSDDPAQLLPLASMYLDLGYGGYVDPEKKLASFQKGARIALKALEQEETSADAHFLYAANLGKATQLQGMVSVAFSLQKLNSHVNRALELDEEHAPAHHMLGRMYEELPWFLGGDLEAAGKHLKKAISLDAHYAPARLDLGKWYLKHGRSQEAAKEFMGVLNTPPLEKRWIWERIHRPQAQILLKQIHTSESPGPPG